MIKFVAQKNLKMWTLRKIEEHDPKNILEHI